MEFQKEAVRRINLVGHLRAHSGLGNTARTFAKALQAHGYAIVGFDIDNPYAPGSWQPPVGLELVDAVEQLPSGINLLVLSLDRASRLLLREFPILMDGRFRNVGMIFWELGVVPPAWRPSLAVFDALVACSRYCQQTYETTCPDVPVVYCEHPLEALPPAADDSVVATRRRLGVDVDGFLAVSSFDARSDIGRKNPFAAIEVFRQAFPGDPGAALVVKVNGHAETTTRQLHEAIAGDGRIRLLTTTLPYHEVRALYAAADVYLSLHRSEGLGLGGMEAMSDGTLVMATAHSGNLSYMTEQNSVLLPYRLVPPKDTFWFFEPKFSGPDARWADVDIEAAAAMLVRCRDDRSLREQLARQGRQDIASRQQTAWDVASLRFLLDRLATGAPADDVAKARRRRRAAITLWAHPRLLERNLRAAMSRARRLTSKAGR